ncbi:iron chelate uptake ABC transporter family permease subunit [Sinomicrobium sp. M5D2P9]
MRKQEIIIGLTAILLMVLFVFFDATVTESFIITGRLERLFTLVLVSLTVAYSTIVFQTISANKILTPSLMGYEHLFVLSQVLMLMTLGSGSELFRSKVWGFVFSTVVMTAYSFVLYVFLFRNQKKNVYYILLIGLVLGMFFSTTTQFLQMAIDPNEYGYVQSAMFSSLGRTSANTLLIASVVVLTLLLYLKRYFRYLDLLNLGREYTMGLGVNYDNMAKKQLLAISVLVSVSTALIGPITFVGIFVSGITYRLSNTASHSRTIVLAFGIALVLMTGAQFAIEHILNYRHSLSVLINLLGGVYFFALIIKQLRK